MRNVNSNLKEQAPSSELCQCIPKGVFGDSALLYYVSDVGWSLLCERGAKAPVCDGYNTGIKRVPAPLLEEIITHIKTITSLPVEINVLGNGKWSISTRLLKSDDGLSYFELYQQISDRLVDAALKLLFELEGIEK